MINSSIYHFKNYIQIQKLNCVLKLRFNNDEVNPRAKKVNTFHATETKWDIRIYCQVRIFSAFIHREGKGINV